jgi:hypothetical protein
LARIILDRNLIVRPPILWRWSSFFLPGTNLSRQESFATKQEILDVSAADLQSIETFDFNVGRGAECFKRGSLWQLHRGWMTHSDHILGQWIGSFQHQ